MSSSKPEKRLYEQGPDVPENSPGSLRRKEAICKGTDVVLTLLDETLEFVREFQYVLFDSWFSWPKLIKGIKERKRDVICMLKDMPTLFYTYQGKCYTLSNLYAKVAKPKKNSGYIASVMVKYYIMRLLVETLQENLFLTKEILNKIITDLINKLPGYIRHRLRLIVQ